MTSIQTNQDKVYYVAVIDRHTRELLSSHVSMRARTEEWLEALKNVFLVGLNNKIRTTMRRAFEFKKLENLIYLIANDQISHFFTYAKLMRTKDISGLRKKKYDGLENTRHLKN